jgi:hypothetical protein
MGATFGAAPTEADQEKVRKEAKRLRKEAESLDLEERELFSELTGLRLVESKAS